MAINTDALRGAGSERRPAPRRVPGPDGPPHPPRSLGLATGRPGRDRHHRLDPRHPVRDPGRGVATVPADLGGARGPSCSRRRAGAGRVHRRGEYREIAYAITADGRLQFTRCAWPARTRRVAVAGLEGANVTSVATSGPGRHLRRYLGRPRGALARDVPGRLQGRARILTPGHEAGAPGALDETRGRSSVSPEPPPAPGPSSSPRSARVIWWCRRWSRRRR